jgi:hypothetical protein
MTVFTVTTLNDENDGGATVAAPGSTGLSLREAIALANASAGADTIQLAAGLDGGTIRLASTLAVTDKLTIDGDNGRLDAGFPNILITGDVLGNDKLAGGLTDIAASRTAGTLGDNVQLFAATAGLTLNGLILTGGSAADRGGAVAALKGLTLTYTTVSGNIAGTDGGGIWTGGAGPSEIGNATISGNSAGRGGGIAGDGSLRFVYATVSGNNADDVGGGIAAGSATLVNSTVSGNQAVHSSGISASNTTLTNSIVLGNGATNSDEVAGALNLTGSNIVGTNVYQGTADVGDTTAADVFAGIDGATGGGRLAHEGSTPAIVLKDSLANPAIDASDNTVSTFWLPFDNPGVPNVNGSPRDLGAAELFPTGGAPKNFLPARLAVEANTDAAISGLLIQDPDAGSSPLTTSLSVLHGKLTIAATSGGASISGNGTSHVVLNGTVGQINAALVSPIYHGDLDYFGVDALTMVTSDHGNAPLAPLTDTDQMSIKVASLFTGTPGNDSYSAVPGNERIDARLGIDTINFGFKLTDAQIMFSGDQVTVDGPGGSHTVLIGFEVFNFTDGTVNNNDSDPLVDDLFYFSRNHDVWNAHADADAHYHAIGRFEGRDPDAFFSTSTYLSMNPDVKAAGVDSLTHFDQAGWKEGRAPSIDFNPAAYLAANPDVKAAGVDPLAQFLQYGAQEGRQPVAFDHLLASNGFDYVYYLQHNPDVAAAHVDPFRHFETVGWKEGRNPNALFDTAGYLAAYADVKAAGINPLDHYNNAGWHEGRDPSVNFDTTDYLTHYADVAAAHINPLTHFLDYGMHEGRQAFADGHFG